jgi:hypothetical protein
VARIKPIIRVLLEVFGKLNSRGPFPRASGDLKKDSFFLIPQGTAQHKTQVCLPPGTEVALKMHGVPPQERSYLIAV